MCGIVGAVSVSSSQRNVAPVLIEGLKKLEYRGYDSAGLAISTPAGIQRVRAVGRVAELERQCADLLASTGIAHTRWATHGGVTAANAHPHLSEREGLGICVVHNGIIENHEALRTSLQSQGYVFESETDTEVIAHLVHQCRRSTKSLLEAVQAARSRLEGAYAIAVISSADHGLIVGARQGAPLLLGLGEDPRQAENFLASDTSALLQVTRRIVYLEDGDVAELQSQAILIHDAHNQPVTRKAITSTLSADAVALGPYAHYMQKEIFEQPGAIAATLEEVMGAHALSTTLFGAEAQTSFQHTRQILILACGTSFHAGMVAKYWLESVARIPVNVEIASEYRYRDAVMLPSTLVVTISQSGETADTLAALQYAIREGAMESLAICNVPESALTRACGLQFLTRAGPEIGVASTKAFTTQLAALFLLTLVLAKAQGHLSQSQEQEALTALRHLPAAMARILTAEPEFKSWAQRFVGKHHALFLGRGIHYPIAMEGALKLKEISYIHAEAYAAGELKHGPLALVDADMPVVAVAPNDQLVEKLKSNLQEVRARGGELYIIADEGSGLSAENGVHVIRLGDHAGLLSPILHVVPLQLLAYHVALARGNDVDKPRNLAKSVTVE
ncbi:MAG: glutamine--fructose-6-phosphate transaminase (isomerizing) [Burkholderiaceae bacterium]|nr:glutamine--fructose-6-phosphate transaminase (isomerizing) [Burkholderiaceae bacterium]